MMFFILALGSAAIPVLHTPTRSLWLVCKVVTHDLVNFRSPGLSIFLQKRLHYCPNLELASVWVEYAYCPNNLFN